MIATVLFIGGDIVREVFYECVDVGDGGAEILCLYGMGIDDSK